MVNDATYQHRRVIKRTTGKYDYVINFLNVFINLHYRYCQEHALKSHLMRVRMGSKHQPSSNAETLLSSLSHYVISNRSRANSSSIEQMEDDTAESDTDDIKSIKSLDPFCKSNLPMFFDS